MSNEKIAQISKHEKKYAAYNRFSKDKIRYDVYNAE